VLGPIVGAQTATATVTGVNGSPLTFTATAHPAANTLTWTSEQLPSGTYGGTWASSAADVFAVGAGGTIRHFNGSSWELQNSGTLNDLHGVWGSSSADVFAVGDGVLHYDGATWNGRVPGNCALPGIPGVGFTGVWGSGPADVYAVGYDVVVCGRTCRQGLAIIDHYDGANWQRSLTDSSEHLTAVWGSANAEVVAVGANGLILHSDGTRWRREASGTADAILAVSGSSARDVWAITSGGLVLHGTR